MSKPCLPDRHASTSPSRRARVLTFAASAEAAARNCSLMMFPLVRAFVLALIALAGLVVTPASLTAQVNFGPLSVSTGSLNFDGYPVGIQSAPQYINIVNTASYPMGIGSIIAAGDFTQTNTCGSSVAAQSSCSISVIFAPTSTGTRSGIVIVFGSYGGVLFATSLTGTGLSASQASFSTATLNFGNQTVGTSSSPQAVTLSDPGTANLIISNVTVTGDFQQTNSCSATITPSSPCTISITFNPSAAGARSGSLTVYDNAGTPSQTVTLQGFGVAAGVTTNISAVWANEGGDKVAQDELRASYHVENLTGNVLNSVWNGSTINLTGAHNEVIDFNLVLEAANSQANNVSVTFDTLTGPGGATIHSFPTSGDGVFNWVGRPIELFYVRYLQITGLSYFGYWKGDERQIPRRFQTPWTGNGTGTFNWYDRPDHFRFYPDIMVPLELTPVFSIAQGQNQSVWSDIYIPKNVPSGVYTGHVLVQENGNTTYTVPVQLNVQNFSLPDTPTTKTMIALDTTDIEWRYVTGYGGYANWTSPGGRTVQQVTDKYYELFHRHKIALLGENECPYADHPCDSTVPRLNGSLYTGANGYDGPGVNTSSGVFSIGSYGTWGVGGYGVPEWRDNESLFQSHIDNWVSWLDANTPGIDYFIYLQDEPPASSYGQIQSWTQWISSDPGPGQKLPSLATVNLIDAYQSIPGLNIPMSHAGSGSCPNGVSPCDVSGIETQLTSYERSTPGHKLWLYNDGHPGTGTLDTEDDGVSPRVIPWTQYKKGVDRWFYWYANIDTAYDLFSHATTWGSDAYFDSNIGYTSGDGKSNGDGVLVYPGTDLGHPNDSYGVHGGFASLRLKEWRRGIQDTDYLALASQIDSNSTQQIINTTVPQALWEYKATDPSFYYGPLSWSSVPDDWEASRKALTQIISNWCSRNPGVNFCSSN